METYIIKIYPHKYMDRANGDHFKADTIASEVSNVIESFLIRTNSKFQNNCTNEGYAYEIHSPELFDTRTIREKIELIFPEVSFIDTWIPLTILSDKESQELEEVLSEVESYYETEAEIARGK